MYLTWLALSSTYFPSSGSLTPGSSITLVVGSGGPGATGSVANGSENIIDYAGGNGAPGKVTITWSDATPTSGPSCSVTFDRNPTTSDTGTTIHWSSSNADWFYINSIGYVSGEGSAWIQPSQTTNYDGTAESAEGEARCPATLTVTGDQCTPSYSCSGDGILNSCTGVVTLCPSGQTCSNGQCTPQCPIGYVMQGGVCVQTKCPGGFQYDPGSAQCVRMNQCTLPPVCSSQTDVLDQCTGATINCTTAYGEGWYCSNGSCQRPPPPSASVSAIPSLVRPGLSTIVSWVSANTSSCHVSGNNGDGPWTGRTGAQTSSAIHAQVIYTLTCNGFDGSAITKIATTNVIPTWIEN